MIIKRSLCNLQSALQSLNSQYDMAWTKKSLEFADMNFAFLKTGLLCRGWGGGGSGSQHNNVTCTGNGVKI